MVIIGESIHIISSDVSRAVKERDPKPIQELAISQTKGGADYIDVNLGPARKNPEENTEWLVKTIQEVTDLPLSIDTMNPVAMEAGLKTCKVTPLLNSASNRTDSKELMLPLAAKYNCDMVLSVFTDTGCPPDVDLRVESILESSAYANSLGIPNERIWIDPVILPVSTAGEGQGYAKIAMELVSILQDVLPGVKSTVGLSNVSNGTPEELRGILNRTFMVMLERLGMYSAIADALDEELVNLSKGKLPEIVDLIHRTMDGEDIDLSSLSQDKQNYVKTTKVLMGDTLYSHAWLEV